MDYQTRKQYELLAIAKAEMQLRRQSDSLHNFEPHKKQLDFIDAVINGDWADVWYCGANRSGKSDITALCGAILARYGDQSDAVKWVRGTGSSISVRDRSTSGWVLTTDFPASRDVMQPKFFNNGYLPPGRTHEPFIPDREIEKWDGNNSILKLKNGSLIGFKSCEAKALTVAGAERDWVLIDEPPKRQHFYEIAIRVGTRRLRIFGGMTLAPDERNENILWFNTEIIKPWLRRERPRTHIITAAIYDNPHIPVTEIQRLEAMYPEGSVQRRVRLEGELLPDIIGARVYMGFNQNLHVKDLPPVSRRHPLCLCIDFNVSPCTATVGQYIDGVFYIYREIWHETGSIEDLCNSFRQMFPSHDAPIYIYGDARGKDRSVQSNKSSYQLILNHLADYPSPVMLFVPESNPPVKARINAVNRAFRNEQGYICVQIDEGCRELIDDFEGVIFDGRGSIKKSFHASDPYSRRTHLSDGVGYWISWEAPVMDVSHQGRQFPSSIPSPCYQQNQFALSDRSYYNQLRNARF